jgi:hypothetical protein
MLYFLLVLSQRSPLITPYAQKAPLAVRSVRPASQSIPCYAALDVDVDLSATFDNPFDPEDVVLEAKVHPGSGVAYTVPGYFDRPYSRKQVNGREVSEPVGPPRWRLRLAGMKPGKHRVEVIARDRTGTTSKEFSFTATAAKTAGFAEISKKDKRFFATSNGKAFYPIGENLCWGGEKGTQDYDRWIPDLGAAKANYARLWLSPAWTTFALETAGKPEEGKGMGQFDLANAARLDYVLGLADRHGVKLLLCIDSFNILRNQDGHNYWEQTPHNAANGGPLKNWKDFWTDPAMARLYRHKLRYLVARYGAMQSVFAWEFWNEVDVIRDFEVAPVRAWHIQMAKALKELDPFDHLVTTSLGVTDGNKEIDLAPGIDFIQTHHYSSPDLAAMVALQQSRKSLWGRPHVVGEIGADVSGDAHAAQDRKGYQAHDPMWASVATGCAGAAQPWYWDSLVEPNKLYPLFTSVAKFVAGVDYPSESFKQSQPAFAYTGTGGRVRRDLTIIGEAATWSAHPLNKPQVRTIRDAKMVGGPIAEIQHGIGNHPDWHNPIEFHVSLDQPMRFEVEVGLVSGHGGATLSLQVDGKSALTKEFVDPDREKTTDLNQYMGTYSITVPAGKHTVKVENLGADWFFASYRLLGVAPPSSRPPIDSWAVVGRTTVLGWAQVSGRTWPRVVLYKNAPLTAPASTMRLGGMTPGTYEVVLWNTWTGTAIRRFKAKAGRNGVAILPLPVIEGDLAFKLVKE